MSPTPDPVRYLRDREDALVDLALDLVGTDTQNPPGRTDETIDRLDAAFASLGVETERVVVDPAKPNLLAALPGERDETLLLNGHVDTVPFDAGAWTRDPLGERDGDRIYGRGATDMKGAVAAMVEAARAFVETDTAPPVTLAFAFVSDEETGGSAGLPAVVDALDADACAIGESTCERGRHSVTAADRGSVWLTLEAEGRSAHGSRPMLGVNAIDRLYDGIETIRREFGGRPLSIDDAVRPLLEESVEYYAPTLGESVARDLFEYPSVNLGTIEGGSAINSVPESARARIDIRLSPGVHTPDVIDDIRECAEACEGVTITDVSWSIGTYEAIDAPIVEATVEAAEAVVGERIYRRSATGGGDAKTLRNAGVPTVEFALGTDTVHAVDEYTTVEALVRNAEIYARLPYALDARL